MIISQTPFRISLAGGGTDLPAFYQTEDYGAVVSTAINKFVYLAIHRYFDRKFLLKYAQTELCERIEDIRHPLIRECLRVAGTTDFLEITSFADIPSHGSGLGSSSSFAVGLLHALYAQRGLETTAEQCAAKACEVELERLGEPIGRQDQYAAAYGGFNYLRFLPDGAVEVEPITMPPGAVQALAGRLMLFYTGVTRQAGAILAEQGRNLGIDEARRVDARAMRAQADALRAALFAGENAALGEVLHEGWERKRRMARGVSSPEFDAIYDRARAAGATGGKLLGAGGGGFFLFDVAPERQEAVRAALTELREVPFGFETKGTRVIYAGNFT